MNLHYAKSEVEAVAAGLRGIKGIQRICEDWLELHRTVVELRTVLQTACKKLIDAPEDEAHWKQLNNIVNGVISLLEDQAAKAAGGE